jgi:gamma-glutamyltranspeptidase
MLSEQPVLGTHGMVATAHYLATHAGLHILTHGGNAIDAAIAAAAAMTVVYPSTCSAGGDVFMLIWEAKTQRLYGLDGSGRAPRGLTPALFAARGLHEMPLRGPLSITVPGAVDGWFAALERFGMLSPETIFAPAIALAEEGMPVSPKLSKWLAEDVTEVLEPWSSSSNVFLPGGRSPKTGEVLRQADLARTYKLLAKHGRDIFYHGPLAYAMTDYIQQCGGVLSIQDLAKHHSEWVLPISTNYRGYDVYELPPSTQGITVLQMLNIIEGYDLPALGYQTPEYLHILLEAKKLAFADRDRYISDPKFAEVPVEHLLHKTYAEQQRTHIDLRKAARHVQPGFEKNGDTTYLCTADRDGNIVSLIQSLAYSFGSGVIGGDTGVLLQNRAAYFSLDPRHVNYLQPAKRTMHTLIPAMVLHKGQPYIALGSMGGDVQPQIHIQLLSAMLDFQKNAQQAVSAPRWRSGRFQSKPGEIGQELRGQAGIQEHLTTDVAEAVIMEEGFSAATALGLDLLGHRISMNGPWEDGIGHAHITVINSDTHIFEGAADPRCDSLALGW